MRGFHCWQFQNEKVNYRALVPPKGLDPFVSHLKEGMRFLYFKDGERGASQSTIRFSSPRTETHLSQLTAAMRERARATAAPRM